MANKNDKELLNSTLAGRVIALPESRQLDVLAALFERRQARVLRIPLVSIHDCPDQSAIIGWLRDFIANPPQLLVALTGEGIRRLREAAQRNGLETEFLATLDKVTVLSRGPKPARVLREMNLPAPLLAAEPTTEGVIETLGKMELKGQRIAVQLYGEDPNRRLREFLAEQALAEVSFVAPYIYADESDTQQVIELIDQMASGEIEMIAFTSKPQLLRLLSVAKDNARLDRLNQGMKRVLVAAVGPVVKQELERAGFPVAIMPQDSFFMKPLVRAAENAFSS